MISVVINNFRDYRYFFGLKSAMRLSINEIFYSGKSTLVQCQNMEYHIRPGTEDLKVLSHGLLSGEFDDMEMDSPKVIIDAGAHIGTFTVFCAERHPNALIIAIEPERLNYAILQENCAKYPNVRTVNAALWFEKGELIVKDRDTGNWGFTMIPDPIKAKDIGQVIPCITVEELIEIFDLERINFFKLDIEGSEKYLFEHSKNWIDRVDVISVELHDRIIEGCESAFRKATSSFKKITTFGEKLTAYR